MLVLTAIPKACRIFYLTGKQRKYLLTEQKKNILNFSPGELKQEIMDLSEEPYRAIQIFNSLHKKNVNKFEEIKNIPAELKQKLMDKFEIKKLRTVQISESEKFNTKKFLFEIQNIKNDKVEKYLIEAVLISEKGRETICISTQVGCNVGCEFCATARMGFQKNLDVSEIISQVYEVKRRTGITPTNIVYMGMGEPFLNYDNMVRSLKILTHEEGLNISAGKITVSTVGFKDKIRKFADELIKSENKKIKKVKFALSLHSTDSGIRESIIPTSKKNRLSQLLPELSYFYQMTRNKITYEYIYFEGLNDTANDIKRIEKLSKMVPCNFNIIPFHPIHFELKKPLDIFSIRMNKMKTFSEGNLKNFISKLRQKGVVTNLRSSSGDDINAACGQLAVIN
jgi:23S rRNA (adenine2503-C2)-methyltransferase